MSVMPVFRDFNINSPFPISNKTYTIDSSGLIRLDYIPKKGTVVITGYEETTESSPTATQYFVDYQDITGYKTAQGYVKFHKSKTGVTVTPSYMGLGTIVWADHMNGVRGHIDNDSTHLTSAEKLALGGTAGTPSTDNKFVTNSDTRLSDSRTPVAHKTSHATGGTDVITVTDIGAVPSSDVVTIAAANKILKLNASGKLPTSITGNADGNASTSTKLQTARNISVSGDATGTISFDGSANVAIPVTLATSGVGAGSYTKITVNAKGIATGGENPTTLNGNTITDGTRTIRVSSSNKWEYTNDGTTYQDIGSGTGGGGSSVGIAFMLRNPNDNDESNQVTLIAAKSITAIKVVCATVLSTNIQVYKQTDTTITKIADFSITGDTSYTLGSAVSCSIGDKLWFKVNGNANNIQNITVEVV